MPTIKICFEGYFQMRMATDPDPSDDPRGLSGYTFALPGEPDFDRKLHFQPDEPGAFQRQYGGPGPRIGVRVTNVQGPNGGPASELVGARVRFIDGEVMERNGVLIRDDLFVIHPLRVRIESNDCDEQSAYRPLLERVDLLDPSRPDLSVMDATAAQLERRQLTGGFQDNSWKVALATGLSDPNNETLIENRHQRQANLVALREKSQDPLERAALTTRIQQLNILERWWDLSVPPPQRPPDRRALQLALLADGWNVDMNGPVLENAIGADAGKLWNISFWLGGWDGDALCGFIQGEWNVPLIDG